MKLTNRMKNAIIQSSIANIIFLLILGVTLILFVVPKIEAISGLTEELQENYSEYNTLLKKGLNYGDLKKTANIEGLSKDTYTTNLLKNVDTNFYKSIFTNTRSQNFSEFLEGLEQSVYDKKSSQEYKKREGVLNSILPVYTQGNNASSQELTDFHFINYIENVLYTFNLSADGEIGIGSLEKVANEFQSDTVVQNSLQEDIFSIPMQFRLTGQKSDIVDFIHFFENVGSVEVAEDSLQIYNDRFIVHVIEGDTVGEGYSVYAHQFADIERIEFKKYPDSATYSSGKNLIASLKGEQAREKMSVEIELDFYVTGIPGYRMEQYIQNVLLDHSKLLAQVSKSAQHYSSIASTYKSSHQLQSISHLQNLNAIIASQSSAVKDLGISFKKREDIQKTYEKAIEIRNVIDWVQSKHEFHLNTLQN